MLRPSNLWQKPLALSLVALLLVTSLRPAAACPFCAAVALTISEEMNNSDGMVIAKLTELPKKKKVGPAESGDVAGGISGTDFSDSKATFTVIDSLKGDVKPGDQLEVFYFGQQPVGSMFLVMGNDPPKWNWAAPIPLTDKAVAYVRKLPSLPASGPERLAFFQNYLEDSDDLLARDSYDEFAKAPYSDVQGLSKQMNHDELLKWIQNPDVSTSHRRLYLTMLSTCGTPEDSVLLESMLKDESDEPKPGLDAMIACYLTLRGPEGMPLVEDLYLKNKDAEYTDTYACIMALRFHGQEETKIEKDRILQALRHMLNRPELADLVIPDLARWEDWTVMDKLVELFKKADEKSSWVRVPVVQYLNACPLPEAQDKIAELNEIDPQSVKRASFFVPLGGRPPAAEATNDDVGTAKAPRPTPKQEPAADNSPADGADDDLNEVPPVPRTDDSASNPNDTKVLSAGMPVQRIATVTIAVCLVVGAVVVWRRPWNAGAA